MLWVFRNPFITKDGFVRRIVFREMHASVFYFPIKIENQFLTTNFIPNCLPAYRVENKRASVKFRRVPYLSGKSHAGRQFYSGNECPSGGDIRLVAARNGI